MFHFPTTVTLFRKVPDDKIHTVSAGETLNAIAIKYETAANVIQERNGMAGTAIYIGQKLTIPAKPGVFKKDDYGNFSFSGVNAKAAITLRKSVVKDREGNEVSSFMEADLPRDVQIDYGDQISYVDMFDRIHRGEVITLEENKDPLGIRVMSWFVTIG